MGRYKEEYSEKEDRRYTTTLWWILWVVFFGILAYTVLMHVSEYKLVHEGKSIVAEYRFYKGVEQAAYYDEENHYHLYDITGVGADHDEDTVVLYYMDDINLAEPKIGAKTWIRSYAIFGTGLILLSIRLFFIYKALNHKHVV